MMRCTESEAYQQAAFYVYKIEPSADAATGCAYQAFKKGDIDGAVKFFDEAIGLETDNVKKAEKHTLPELYWLLLKTVSSKSILPESYRVQRKLWCSIYPDCQSVCNEP